MIGWWHAKLFLVNPRTVLHAPLICRFLRLANGFLVNLADVRCSSVACRAALWSASPAGQVID